MKFNALQKYFLEIYAIVIIFLTIFVPVTNSNGYVTYGFILLDGNIATINIAFLLTEYLALTLALVACLFACNEIRKK